MRTSFLTIYNSISYGKSKVPSTKAENKAKQDLVKLGVSAEFGELNEAAFSALRELYDMILPSEGDADA